MTLALLQVLMVFMGLTGLGFDGHIKNPSITSSS
jgi:hypothetical protein